MFLYSIRNKIKNAIIENFQYNWYLFKSKSIESKEKIVFIDICEILPNRYLYNFIKFFELNGYTVYLPKNKKLISFLSKKRGEFIYTSWILKEKIKFGKPNSPDLIISRDQLSNNYFEPKNGLNEYNIPMSEYPAFYFHQIKTPIVELNRKRKKSVFMSGNLDPVYYHNISKSKIFDVLSRREVADYVMKQKYYLEIHSIGKLKDFIISDSDCKVLLIDTKEKFRIPLKDLKTTLLQFNFYLALPGILIPQSHNLIEAMSVGCIPVIHINYASLFTPTLKHMENAIVFNSLEELDSRFLDLFNLDDNKIHSMHQNVYQYFQNYLSPNSVVSRIENNHFSKIYIQAEWKSLELLKRNYS